jgi:hypothetical protein
MDPFEALRLCTVRIATSAPQRQGTGFLVAPGTVLTCAHVVTGDNGGPVSKISVYISEGESEATVESLLSAAYPDIALLTIKIQDHPCVFLDGDVKVRDKLYSFGFPSDQRTTRGEGVTLEVEGERIVSNDGAEERLLKFKGGQVLPGSSGAPLLNERTLSVCGVLKRTRDDRSDLGGFGVPASVMLAKLSGLAQRQREYHLRDSSWRNMAIENLKERKPPSSAPVITVQKVMGDFVARDKYVTSNPPGRIDARRRVRKPRSSTNEG